MPIGRWVLASRIQSINLSKKILNYEIVIGKKEVPICMCRYLFRAGERKKQSIASNIVNFMNDDCSLSKEAARFISDWVLTGPEEKTKAYFDIWNKILDSYLPTERPILFRSCLRVSHRSIQSFSRSMSAVERLSEGHKGHVLVCDTKEYMRYLNFEKRSGYNRNFFPVYELVEKDLASSTPHFTQKFYNEYKGEDEYIVRVDLNCLYNLKWS